MFKTRRVRDNTVCRLTVKACVEMEDMQKYLGLGVLNDFCRFNSNRKICIYNIFTKHIIMLNYAIQV